MAENRSMRGPMGPGHGRRVSGGVKVKNPGRILKRIAGYLFRYYPVQLILVALCIVLNVAALIQGTLFIKTLIDDYIAKPTPKHFVAQLFEHRTNSVC